MKKSDAEDARFVSIRETSFYFEKFHCQFSSTLLNLRLSSLEKKRLRFIIEKAAAMKTWISGLLIFGFVSTFSANASAAFTIMSEGDRVCRIRSEVSEDCFPSAKAAGFSKHTQIKIVDQIKRKHRLDKRMRQDPLRLFSPKELRSVGATTYLGDDRIKRIEAKYSKLNVRNMAFLLHRSFRDVEGEILFPFFASVEWASRLSSLLHGTLHVTGTIRMPENLMIANPDEFNRIVRSKIGTAFSVQDFTDGTSEYELVRRLEWAARQAHHTFGRSEGRTPDAATAHDLADLAGAAVISQLLTDAGADRLDVRRFSLTEAVQ